MDLRTRILRGVCNTASAVMLLILVSAGVSADESVVSKPGAGGESAAGAAGDVSLSEFIDQQIRQGWTDNEIEASPQAPDEEWVRRVYLDLVGRIPTLAEVRSFLDDKNPRKRSLLVDSLLENEDYVRHFTTIWSNNSIGRATPQRVSRIGMGPAANRPYGEYQYRSGKCIF